MIHLISDIIKVVNFIYEKDIYYNILPLPLAPTVSPDHIRAVDVTNTTVILLWKVGKFHLVSAILISVNTGEYQCFTNTIRRTMFVIIYKLVNIN